MLLLLMFIVDDVVYSEAVDAVVLDPVVVVAIDAVVGVVVYFVPVDGVVLLGLILLLMCC